MNVRDKLIKQINKIENEELMFSISNMLSHITENGVYNLEPQQLDELLKRSVDISKGNYSTHTEVSEKYNK